MFFISLFSSLRIFVKRKFLSLLIDYQMMMMDEKQKIIYFH